MTVQFPAVEGTRLDSFPANLDKRGDRTVELWASTSSIDRIVRWPVEAEVETYGEAVANRVVAVSRNKFPLEALRRALEEASGQRVDVARVGERFTVFAFDDESSFWPRFRTLQASIEDIAYLEPDFLTRVPPPDPDWVSTTIQDELAQIGAREPWAQGLETSDALVAVLDTGIELDHPVLSSRAVVANGANLVAPGQAPADDHGDSHGTYCSGLIAGDPSANHFDPDSARFGGGVLRKGKIYPIKSHDRQGICPTTRAADAITLASRDLGAKIICASWTMVTESQHLKDSIANAGRNGCLFVTAAGNQALDLDNGSRLYPASFDLSNIVVVGGLNDRFAPVDDWGVGISSVDLSAPGETIQGPERRHRFQSLSGTSASTAIVAGAAALVQQAALYYRRTLLSPAELKYVLLESVRPVSPQYPKRTCTGGILHVADAVSLAARSFTLPRVPRCP